MESLNIDRVRAILHARVSCRGIDVDKVYITGVNTIEQKLVIYSESLVWACFLVLQEGRAPEFGGEHMGIFSERYTFDDNYRFNGLDFDEVNGLGADLAKIFLPETAAA